MISQVYNTTAFSRLKKESHTKKTEDNVECDCFP